MENNDKTKEKKLDNDETFKSRENALNNWEKRLKSEKEEIKSREDALNCREKMLEKLCCFRCRIRLKQFFLTIPILLLVIVIICIVGVLLGFISDVVEGTIAAAPNLIGSFLVIISGIKGISAIIVLLLMIFFVVYGAYLTIKNFRRYQNALNKLNLLIMKLELYTDKDLVISSRLGRELDMIYRILES